MNGMSLSETLRAMSVWIARCNDVTAETLAKRLSTIDPFIVKDRFEGYGAGEAFCAFCNYQEPHHGEHCPLHALAMTPDALEQEMTNESL